MLGCSLVAGVLRASLLAELATSRDGVCSASRLVFAASSALHACSALAPHEVGECHRLWRVSFCDFVCLLEGGRDEGADVVCYSATSCVFWREEAEEGARAGAHPCSRLCSFPRPRRRFISTTAVIIAAIVASPSQPHTEPAAARTTAIHAQTVHDRPSDTARNHRERVLLPRHSHDARAGIDGSLNADSQETQGNDDDSPLLEQPSAVLRDGPLKPSSDLSSQAVLSRRGQCAFSCRATQPIGQLCAMKNDEKQEDKERQSRGCP